MCHTCMACSQFREDGFSSSGTSIGGCSGGAYRSNLKELILGLIFAKVISLS